MLITSFWLYKLKVLADTIWCFVCLICVPSIVVTGILWGIPQLQSAASGHGSFRSESASADSSFKSSRSTHGLSRTYTLGLYDQRGHLVMTLPDQSMSPTVTKGSMLVELPQDIPDGEYQLQIQTSTVGGYDSTRSIPIQIGGRND